MVAIIAVLVAISIPIFTSQLEKSRETVDAANIRAAYAEASAEMLLNDASTKTWDVPAKQTKTGWQGTDYSTGDNKIGGLNVPAATLKGWTIGIDNTNNKVTIAEKTA